MNTPSGLLTHRAVVHSVDAATGACKVRIPSILGGQVITVEPVGNLPLVGTNVLVCSTSDLSEFFFVTSATEASADATKQPLDADLTAIAALPSAADTMPYATGSSTWALTGLSSFARTLVDDADAATMRTTLGIPVSRNLLHNGEMLVSQRYPVNSFTTATGASIYTDRWLYAPPSIATTSVYPSYLQSFEDFAGFQIIDAGSVAKPSYSAGEYSYLRQSIEGRNLQHLRWGTAQAQPLCLSFVAFSTTPGTYIIEFEVPGANSISRAVTLTGTSARYYVTIPGLTTTTLANNSNGSLAVNFWLGASATYSSGPTLNSAGWTVGSNATRAFGQTNMFAVAGRQFWLTGVQLEIGTTPTAFEHLTYVQTLTDCMRYYEETGFVVNSSAAPPYFSGYWKVPKRALPTVTVALQVGSGAVVRAFSAGFGDLMGFYQDSSNSANSNSVVKGNAEI